jgi:hypothetical protein
MKTVIESATIMDCGGKRSATPLSSARTAFKETSRVARAKALSPLRSASAVQNKHDRAR